MPFVLPLAPSPKWLLAWHPRGDGGEKIFYLDFLTDIHKACISEWFMTYGNGNGMVMVYDFLFFFTLYSPNTKWLQILLLHTLLTSGAIFGMSEQM